MILYRLSIVQIIKSFKFEEKSTFFLRCILWKPLVEDLFFLTKYRRFFSTQALKWKLWLKNHASLFLYESSKKLLWQFYLQTFHHLLVNSKFDPVITKIDNITYTKALIFSTNVKTANFILPMDRLNFVTG